ncbi:MAG: MTAP family purine nucleoside phosphorylase [Selenomonadaceae bacterium]|nr:MTAP family purine nucleoside phosphorylase [Selenomonadaceae bacterium]
MTEKKIPFADFAIIGGSGTLSSNFPNNLQEKNFGVEILEENLFFETPYGKSPAFKIFSYAGKKIFTCKMHGWRSGVTRADASRQIFWIFREAGVKKILSEGGVGTINHLLNPRDLMIPDDYLDLSVRKDVMLDGRYLLVMRDALCPNLREKLLIAAKKNYGGRIFEHGIYAVTDGRHFESPAEISMLKGHADIVGQSLAPEVYLAREIGACYANLSFVVNYGEGIKNWSQDVMKEIFFNDAEIIGKILLEVIKNTDAEKISCHCHEFRKETLLKEVYNEESEKG